MAQPKQDWIDYYGLQDIPKRAWIAPITYQTTKQMEAAHNERSEVVAVVKDRIWINMFIIGVIVGTMTIVGLVWKATLL